MMMKLFIFAIVLAVTMAVPADHKNDEVRKTLEGKGDADFKTTENHLMKEIQMIRRDFQSEIRDLKKHNEDLKQEIKNMQNEREMNSQTIFLAKNSAETLPVGDGEVIVWDSAPINPGGYYSTATGGYTAPSNGYYQFTVSKQGDEYYGSFSFLVDDEPHALHWIWASSGTSTPTHSNTINIQLTAGQVVKVQNIGSTFIGGTDSEGSFTSWFTGHLLYAL